MKLKELEIGDRFYAKNDKKRIVYVVNEKPQFNIHHGQPTRLCFNTVSFKVESKSCGLEVVKTDYQHKKKEPQLTIFH